MHRRLLLGLLASTVLAGVLLGLTGGRRPVACIAGARVDTVLPSMKAILRRATAPHPYRAHDPWRSHDQHHDPTEPYGLVGSSWSSIWFRDMDWWGRC